jgi:DNA-binding NarL/FixJ family response regulator
MSVVADRYLSRTASRELGLPIRILLVDQYPIVRAAVRKVVESQSRAIVVGEAANPAEASRIVRLAKPDLVLLELGLGQESGLDFLSEVRSFAQPVRAVILTSVVDPQCHQQAVELGALGIVSKSDKPEVLLTAIERVHNGEVWLGGHLISSVLTHLLSPEERRETAEAIKIKSLTPREQEMISLVCAGLKNKQIADELSISEVTVRHHLTSVFSKLDVGSRFELLIYAYKHCLSSRTH